MKEELLHIKKELSKKLKKERFEHTVGVMYTSASLAKILFRKRAVKIV